MSSPLMALDLLAQFHRYDGSDETTDNDEHDQPIRRVIPFRGSLV